MIEFLGLCDQGSTLSHMCTFTLCTFISGTNEISYERDYIDRIVINELPISLASVPFTIRDVNINSLATLR